MQRAILLKAWWPCKCQAAFLCSTGVVHAETICGASVCAYLPCVVMSASQVIFYMHILHKQNSIAVIPPVPLIKSRVLLTEGRTHKIQTTITLLKQVDGFKHNMF